MEIKQRALHAVKWTSITTVLSQIITLIISIVKFRLLEVEVFGIMAIVTAIISIMRMVQTIGFGPAIVQKETISDTFVNSVFWVVLCISLLLSTCLILLSGWISSFYNIEILSKLLLIGSVQFVFSSLIIVQNSLLGRDLKFKIIGLIGLCSTIGEGLIIIGFALNSYGIWSIVFGSIGSSIITFCLYLKYVKWFPSFVFSLDAIKPSMGFGFNLTLNKFIGIIKLNAPQLIIGKFLGAEILGLYSFAKNIILQIINNIDAMVSQVLFPMFSRLQNDKTKLVKGYLKVNHYNFLLSIPILAGYIFIATDLVSIVYGQKWLAAITISQILLISIIVNSIYSKGSSLITGGLGKPDLLLKIDLFLFVPLLFALIITVQYSIIYLAIAVVVERCIAFTAQQIIIKREINFKFRMFLKSMQAPFVASIIMLMVLSILEPFAPKTTYPKLSLVGLIISGGFTYFLCVLWLDRKELISTIKLLFQAK